MPETDTQESSSPITCSSASEPVPAVPLPTAPLSSAPTAVKPKEKLRKGKNKTLALTPEEFEKENLKVERDACRLELAKLATEKKDMGETVEILTTRCRLLEEARNTAATKLAAPKALLVPNLNTPEPAPAGSSSPLETLINLEVLQYCE